MEQTFELILNTNSFKIPSRFDRLTKVSINVYNKLIFDTPHQYIVESNTSENVLKSYIQYWVHEEIPNITIGNFYEYYNLSQEFGLLTELIEQKKKEFGQDLQYYEALKDENSLYLDKYEEEVSRNLDNYLDRYGIEMMNLPISILFNIFNHPNCNLNNHDLAYNLIKNQYKQTNDLNIFLLLTCIDGAKLNQENMEDSIISKNLHANFTPKFDHNCICSALQKQREMEKQIFKIDESSSRTNFNIDQLSTQFNSYKLNQEKELNDLKELIKNNEEKNTNQINDLKKLISDQAEEIDDLKIIIKKQEEQIKSNQGTIKIQLNSFSSYIEEIKHKFSENNDINELKETVKSQIEKFNALKIEQSKLTEEVNKSMKKNEDKIDEEIKKLDEKINSMINDTNSLKIMISEKGNEKTISSSNNNSSSNNSPAQKLNQFPKDASKSCFENPNLFNKKQIIYSPFGKANLKIEKNDSYSNYEIVYNGKQSFEPNKQDKSEQNINNINEDDYKNLFSPHQNQKSFSPHFYQNINKSKCKYILDNHLSNSSQDDDPPSENNLSDSYSPGKPKYENLSDDNHPHRLKKRRKKRRKKVHSKSKNDSDNINDDQAQSDYE